MDWDMGTLYKPGCVDSWPQLSPERSVDSGDRAVGPDNHTPREEGQSRHEAAFYTEYLVSLLAWFEEQQPGLRIEVIPAVRLRSLTE